MNTILQMEPCFGEEERNHLNEYMLAGGWVTEFKKTREFEEMIAAYTGARYCSVVANGTVALSVALMACGVTVGDEVVCPDYTMVATPNSAEMIGAKAVFADISRENLCLDFESMKKAVTNKTKAVMLVSINGRFPQNIEDYIKFCEENHIWLIEDACQSLGSTFQGKHIGRFGRIGVFSFSAPKIITTGQGGALITDDEILFEKIKKIRDFGRERGGIDHYMEMGWNFKFTDIQAIIGIEQMKKLHTRVERKKQMGKLYAQLLDGIDGVELINADFSATAPWFFDMLCENREELMLYLKEKGIGTREFYPPLHSEPVYGYKDSYPVAEDTAARGLWLPSSILVTDEQIRYICESIKEFYK